MLIKIHFEIDVLSFQNIRRQKLHREENQSNDGSLCPTTAVIILNVNSNYYLSLVISSNMQFKRFTQAIHTFEIKWHRKVKMQKKSSQT